MPDKHTTNAPTPLLAKSPTGIQGLDEVTGGGLPKGRPTLVCGAAGCGKTLLAIEFLVRGATEFGEPGVFMAFEETAEELAQNVRSLGLDLQDLIARKLLAVDYVRVERSEIEETGEYDLEGLFVRLGLAIDTLKAKRVVLDTLEVLFGGLDDAAILRAEIRRLFRWLKDRGVTAMVTGERGKETLTRYGLEEYVSDCVILLDHRVNDQVSTRRLRVVKYRGSAHGTNEFPFLIGETGITVVPITSAGMEHRISTERISSGVRGIDDMLGGKGFFRGTSILVSGTSGTGKTSIAAHFADAACRRGERCLYFSFEESQGQIMRNMRSIGLDLEPWTTKGLLTIRSARPTLYGLEMHLALMHKLIRDAEPRVVIVDPISNFLASGTASEAGSMLVRLLDYLKQMEVTSLFTNLTHGGANPESSDTAISSIIDTWLLLRDAERDGRREGRIYVLKSRGMAHSRHVKAFRLTDSGIQIDGDAAVEFPAARLRRSTMTQPHGPLSPDPENWELRLYVAGQTAKSLTAFANLKRVCDQHLAGKYSIEVVDLLQNPQLAQGDEIIAIPTLVRKLPEPIRKIIGDLSNTERVLVGLQLRPSHNAQE